MIRFAVMCAAAFPAAAQAPVPTVHLPLAETFENASAIDFAITNHGVTFSDGSAYFNGRDAYLEIERIPAFDALAGDVTVSAWVHTEAALDDTLGDIVSTFDPAARRGINFGFMNYHGVTTSQSNYRNLFFGVDDGGEAGPWVDCGRPGEAVYVMAMAVHDGALYAGTFEIEAGQTGHVYRYDGGGRWVDCGAPFPSNAVSALAVHDGALYAAASHYRSGGSAMKAAENTLHGGRVFRYAGGTEWVDCGKLGESEAIYGLVSFDGRLYGSSLYAPMGFFRYDGGETWTDLGTAGGRVEALGVHNGALYGTGFDQDYAGVSRFNGGSWTYLGAPPETTQTYSFIQYRGALHVGSWPSGKVFVLNDDATWGDTGPLESERESMGMAVYNGMLYAGSLPLAAVYRYDGAAGWTNTGQLDTTPDVQYRRAWSMAVYDGKLFCGVLPSGRVYSLETGAAVSHDRAVSPGWVHVAGVRSGEAMTIYANGERVARRDVSADSAASTAPMRIGFGQHDYFNGRMRDLRVYGEALDAEAIAALAAE